jgi:hypothetical protein
MPSLCHQALSSDSPHGALEANGAPLSLRIASGRPNWSKTRSSARRTPWVSVLDSATQASK